jgi:hypothetical protein
MSSLLAIFSLISLQAWILFFPELFSGLWLLLLLFVLMWRGYVSELPIPKGL